MDQSIVLGEIKAEAFLQNENPMNDQIIWQQYIQQVESLSLENKVSRFCMEARFMRIVEVGQYFMTKDTGSLKHFRSLACREYTPPRDDPASQAKGWIHRKHENRACIGSHDQFSTLQIWNWNSNLVCEQRQFSFLGQNFQWNGQICDRFYWGWKFKNSCRSTRRANSTNKHECGCRQVKSKSKTSTKRICWDDSNHTNTQKKMGWHWTITTKSCFVRFLEESDQSSSTQSNVTARTKWSNWILQN